MAMLEDADELCRWAGHAGAAAERKTNSKRKLLMPNRLVDAKSFTIRARALCYGGCLRYEPTLRDHLS